MPYYLIKETLEPCTKEDIHSSLWQFAAVLTPEEYAADAEGLNMGIDIEIDLAHIHNTKAVVNYDSLTGTLNIPDNIHFGSTKYKLAFVLDEKGIVLIDADDYSLNAVEAIRQTRKWRFPSMERFIYDFLEQTIAPDHDVLDNIENNLNDIEQQIMKGDIETYPVQLNDIRYGLLDLHTHYMHMIDLAKELEENENSFFHEENLRYFRLFSERIERLRDQVQELRDYIIQLRDLTGEQLSIKQNRIMTLLTVITAIFMPLTLIAGWYGMNFVNMPELRHPHGYYIVIAVSVLIVVLSLVWFRKKKWL
ncbi:MAG: hypothetical protein K6G61_04935 [Solobacterium sp.]|nr:hypothetical protein [Solobacterium sp.]